MDFGSILGAAVVLIVMMDPFASLPVFLSMTKRVPNREKGAAADRAALVAGLTLIAFTLAGPPFLGLIGVSMESFMVGGGIMLLLIAISMVLGINFSQGEEQHVDVAVVLVAVPLITGPGAMTTAIILAGKTGLDNVLVAIVLASVAMWLVLRAADRVYRTIGQAGNEVISRISGLLLSAIAVEFIRHGLGA